jgi:hypothetical protein
LYGNGVVGPEKPRCGGTNNSQYMESSFHFVHFLAPLFLLQIVVGDAWEFCSFWQRCKYAVAKGNPLKI